MQGINHKPLPGTERAVHVTRHDARQCNTKRQWSVASAANVPSPGRVVFISFPRYKKAGSQKYRA